MQSTERVERIRATVREERVPVAALVVTFGAAIFINVAAEQVTEARVGRFGAVGRDLSEQEIAQISDLGNAAGKPPWLILGFRVDDQRGREIGSLSRAKRGD